MEWLTSRFDQPIQTSHSCAALRLALSPPSQSSTRVTRAPPACIFFYLHVPQVAPCCTNWNGVNKAITVDKQFRGSRDSIKMQRSCITTSLRHCFQCDFASRIQFTSANTTRSGQPARRGSLASILQLIATIASKGLMLNSSCFSSCVYVQSSDCSGWSRTSTAPWQEYRKR